MEWYCHLRNVYGKMADGKRADTRTYGVTFDGPVIPFGATVSWKPIAFKGESRLRQLGEKW